MQIFKLTSWSTLEKTLEQRPNVFLSQFVIIGIIACLIQVINDLVLGAYLASALDLLVAIILLIAYRLNERRKHLMAKFIFIGIGTLVVFAYSAIIPKEIGLYYVFFPLFTITFLIFNNDQQRYKYLAIAYIASLFITLELTNYMPFGDLQIYYGESSTSSYYVNLLSSIGAIVFSMYNIDVINNEITKQRKQIELQLKDRNEELAQINEELDHFVYSASHDLKAPLLSILGLINVARYDTEDQKVISIFNRIEDRIKRLSTFIKDVIEISRNSRTDVVWEEVNLFDLVLTIIDNNLYKEGSESIDFNCDDLKGKIINADRTRLEIIINNLISNAIKYRDSEKKHHKIKVSAKLNPTKVSLSVQDNGQGIEEEQLNNVFRMFYRGAGNSEGSGLGLYIVKKIVDKLEGTVRIRSKVKEGTEIRISLPLKHNHVPLFSNVKVKSSDFI